MGSSDLARRIAEIFLDDWVGEFAGFVNPRRRNPVPQPQQQASVPPRKTPQPSPSPTARARQGKITPEILAFIKGNPNSTVPNIKQEILRQWGITLGTRAIYKVWNGWTPLGMRIAEIETNITPIQQRAIWTKKLNPEVLEFIKSNRSRVPELQKEIFCKWGLTISSNTIYRIWRAGSAPIENGPG